MVDNTVEFGPESKYKLATNWKKYRIAITEFNKSKKLNDVTSVLMFRGVKYFDGKNIQVKNIYYSK